jgi:hypothetical protein
MFKFLDPYPKSFTYSHELTPIPLSAMQRGGIKRCMLEPSPSLRSREGDKGGEFMLIGKVDVHADQKEVT